MGVKEHGKGARAVQKPCGRFNCFVFIMNGLASRFLSPFLFYIDIRMVLWTEGVVGAMTIESVLDVLCRHLKKPFKKTKKKQQQWQVDYMNHVFTTSGKNNHQTQTSFVP